MSKESVRGTLNRGLATFTQQAPLVYSNRYDYTDVVWRGWKVPVTVNCAEHGEFNVRPDLHVRRGVECGDCKCIRRKQTSSRLHEKPCVMCGMVKPLTDFHISKHGRGGKAAHCKGCISISASLFYSNNKNKILQRGKEYREKTNHRHSRQWYLNNKEHFSTYRKIWYYANRNYILLQQNKYRRSAAGKAKRQVYDAARRVKLTKCTPSWCNPLELLAIYKQCVDETIASNVLHEVDHYYSINGRTVCGLHVPSNLRIIPATENRKKGNKHPDDFYST